MITTKENSGERVRTTDAESAGAVPRLDARKYRHYVDDFDLTEERKTELLETLWSIMYAFVQLGYGVESIHRHIPALSEISSEADSDDVEGEGRKQFNGAATERKDE